MRKCLWECIFSCRCAGKSGRLDSDGYPDGVHMVLALQILLIAFCVQGLVKFAVGFLVPYPIRIRRIALYERGGRIISI